MEVPKPPPLRPSIGTPDTVTVAVTFAPPDVEEIRRVADLSLFAQIEPLEQMREFLEAVFAVKLQTTSTNRLGKARGAHDDGPVVAVGVGERVS